MKSIFGQIVTAVIVCCITSFALADAFRTTEGKVVAAGLSRAEVMALLGEPQSRHVETLGLSSGSEPGQGRTVETWTYFTEGSIGNDVLLTLTIESGEVTNVQVEKRP